MKLVVQRVKNSNVKVDEKIVGKINKGFLVLCGITHNDTEKEVQYLAKKLINLRVFQDKDDKMNLSIKDVEGELLVISQFTLYADCTSGNRPSFINAAKPEDAKKLYNAFIEECQKYGVKVEKGIFGADMKVSLINDGPVTIILEK